MNVYIFILGIVVQLCYTNCQKTIPWNNHVYSGRHLDDYITTPRYGPPNVCINALFIMYTPECEEKMEEALGEEKLPPEKYMVFAKHDYVTFPKAIWYQLDERDDLVYRYKPKSCLKVMFFKNGSTIHDPEVYDQENNVSIASWTWGKLKVKFVVINRRNEDVVIDIIPWHANQRSFSLKPWEVKDFSVHVSDIVYILSTTNGNILFAKVVESDFPGKVVIDGYVWIMPIFHLEHWLEAKQYDISVASSKNHDVQWFIAYQFLICLHQARNLPRFTEKGYKKTAIPKELYQEMLTFYFSNENQRRIETKVVDHRDVINHHDSRCTMVDLSSEMEDKIHQALHPMLERWCNCSLEKSVFYGIREYYHRNILRSHVDRIATHVISAILQIHKDLDGAEDWPLQIVGMDGVIQQVYLEPGEMLLYESTTLIHGRPSPFQGRLFANTFIHYKPKLDWDWDNDGEQITNRGRPMWNLNTLYLTDEQQKNIPN